MCLLDKWEELFKMQFEYLKSQEGETIEGLLLLKPEIYKDSRGFFMESWNAKEFNKVVKKEVLFIQDNHSNSVQGVLRGLHYLEPFLSR